MYLINRFEHEHELVQQKMYTMSEYVLIGMFCILTFIIVHHIEII